MNSRGNAQPSLPGDFPSFQNGHIIQENTKVKFDGNLRRKEEGEENDMNISAPYWANEKDAKTTRKGGRK
jgi:hypothetical protein